MKNGNVGILLFFFAAVISSCAAKMTLAPQEVFVEGNSRDIQDFYIFQTELTVGEYKRYLELSGEQYDFDEWKYYEGPLNDKIVSDLNPMANVEFIRVVRFANWLSKDHKLKPAYKVQEDQTVEWDRSANGYRAPTTAEWEWAARGGVKSQGYTYPGSDNVDEVAWYAENTGGWKEAVLPIVGMKKPNELGIYDMFGSVAEWCWEQYFFTESEDSLGVVGEIQLKNGKYAIPYDNQSMDAYRHNEIGRVTRGLYFIAVQEYFTYQTDISLLPDHLGEHVGIRLVRNAR